MRHDVPRRTAIRYADTYGSTDTTPSQFEAQMKDLMSEGLSIGKALAEQGKGYYEEMKAAPKVSALQVLRSVFPQSKKDFSIQASSVI